MPGGLNVRRRAGGLRGKLEAMAGGNSEPLHAAVDWLQAYAMAVNFARLPALLRPKPSG